MLSAAAGDAGERDAPTVPPVATAPVEIGFDTSKPVRGSTIVGPTLSVHAPNRAAQANMTIRRRIIRSARTAVPFASYQSMTDTACTVAHRLPPSLTNPAQ